MEILKTMWNFFQTEILGINWLNQLTRKNSKCLWLKYTDSYRRQYSILYLRCY